MRHFVPLVPFLFLGTLLAALLPSAVRSPETHWLDSRHVAVTWTQEAPANVCVGRIAAGRGDYVLIGCGPVEAGTQQLILPTSETHDAETEPLEGDVYDVGGVRTAPLGPVPRYDTRLPLVRR